MPALMQRVLPEGTIPTEAPIAQLQRREMGREKAAFAAAGAARTAAMKTDWKRPAELMFKVGQ